MAKLTAKYVRSILAYDPISGIFHWKVSLSNRAKVGSVAGCDCAAWDGYRRVRLDGVLYQAHRLAWLVMTGKWPPAKLDIDHKDGNRGNNVWHNLRLATRQQNLANARVRPHNKLGIKGVCFNPRARSRPYRASIWVDGRNIHLGCFATAEEAAAAYAAAASEHFGEFARS